MTAATKARLRAVAAAKKGTETLKGYDAVKWFKAVEQAIKVNKLADVPMALRSGMLSEVVASGGSRLLASKGTFEFAFNGTNGETTHTAWGRFRHDSPAHLEEMCNAIPHRIVRVMVFNGKAQVPTDVAVFPIAKLLTILFHLFGNTMGTTKAARKYLIGYDDTFVRNSPGVRQKFTIDSAKWGPLVGPGDQVELVDIDEANSLMRFRADTGVSFEAYFREVRGSGNMLPLNVIGDGLASLPADIRREKRAKQLDGIFARFGLEID